MGKLIIQEQGRGLTVQHGNQYVFWRDKWDALHEVGQILDQHEENSSTGKNEISTQ